MRKIFTLLVVSLSLFVISTFGQEQDRVSGRFSGYVDTLKRRTSDLSSESYSDLRRSYRASRAEIEEAMLAAQIDGAASVLVEMSRDNKTVSEFRDAISFMQTLMRNAPTYGSNSFEWRNVRSAFDDVSRELGGGGYGGGYDNPVDNRPVIGRAYWRGQVDDKLHLSLSNSNIDHRTISGSTMANGTYSFTSPLPNRNVEVQVIKKKGRGNVRVIQQPSKANGFSAVIEVSDNDGGAKEYQLEIIWR